MKASCKGHTEVLVEAMVDNNVQKVCDIAVHVHADALQVK